MFYSLAISHVHTPYQMCITHPFVTQLKASTLPKITFAYYIQQDQEYLKHYVICLRKWQLMVPKEYQSFIEEMIQEVETKEVPFQRRALSELPQVEYVPDQITIRYIEHLYASLATKNHAYIYASLLACPFIYQKIAQDIELESIQEPLYKEWFSLYQTTDTKQIQEMQEVRLAEFCQLEECTLDSCVPYFMQSMIDEALFFAMPLYQEVVA
ncbi:thiaminase (transcriptional activator TenA) [Enterococcus sp. AZ150]|uniref:Aminopyrimidine aminohydrolase n=2 Tax=Enterococcus TaxID=1350 RepID=S0P150_9ENTE|nr:hypothetical protein [Enterococcus sulfureus]EOT48650.1 hypothetical protein OMY_00605 [Enterococcus sulfureus ATCC 49903]EOT87542.1 hypothetical protein I573_00598 [Enterococcus sulfureus ATCC 49903]